MRGRQAVGFRVLRYFPERCSVAADIEAGECTKAAGAPCPKPRLEKSAVQFSQMTVISRLLHEGTLDVGYQDPGKGNALLHIASSNGQFDMVNVLLNHGANIDLPNNHGSTPLQRVVWEERSQIVFRLLERGADSTKCDDDTNTPWYLAADEGAAILKILIQLQKAKLSVVTANSVEASTPLVRAAETGPVETLTLLLDLWERGELDHPSHMLLFHYPALSGKLAAVELLLQKGFDPMRIYDGEITLHWALDDATEAVSIDIIRLLLDKGVDPCSAPIDDERVMTTAIYYLCAHDTFRKRDPDLWQAALLMLCKGDRRLDMLDADGFAPVHLLCHPKRARPWAPLEGVLVGLHDLGDDLDIKTRAGSNFFRPLLDSIHSRLVYGPTAVPEVNCEVLANMIIKLVSWSKNCSLLDETSSGGHRPLSTSIQTKLPALARRLLELNQDVDEADTDRFKHAPLEYACLVGCKKDLFGDMLQRSKYLNRRRPSGATLFHLALSKSCRDWLKEEDLVRGLLAAGLDPDIANSTGAALPRAAERGPGQVSQALNRS